MQKIFQVDAFSSKPFSGNPAAVCIMESAADESWMQRVAAEMNLSETAFLYKQNNKYQLRWFTPTIEVALCGHATLASAHILWSEKYSDSEVLIFSTKSGDLSAKRNGEMIELDFPATQALETAPPPGLLEALGVSATFVGKNSVDFLLEVYSEKTLKSMSPDFTALGKLPVRGVIVTARPDSSEFNGYDFLSRFFAPASGIDEDPVTGSAHCTLAPHWANKLSKTTLKAYQVSARGGAVTVSVAGERVLIRGQAFTVLRGELEF